MCELTAWARHAMCESALSKLQQAFGEATTCHDSNTGVNKLSPEDAWIRITYVCVYVCMHVRSLWTYAVRHTMLPQFLTFQCQLRKPSKRQTRYTIVTYRSVRQNTVAN
jgi:hypothetical protein